MQITQASRINPVATVIYSNGSESSYCLAVSKILEVLDFHFQGRLSDVAKAPGKLTEMLNKLPEEKKDLILLPSVCVAIITARALNGQDFETERRAVEMGMLGQIAAKFHNNNNRSVAANNLLPTNQDIQELGKRTVDSYLRKFKVPANAKILDVGTGKGFVPAALQKRGYKNVHAIEPVDVKNGEQIAFLNTVKATAHEFLLNNPDKKFDWVNVCNLSPDLGQKYLDVNAIKEFVSCLSKMTADHGFTLYGISSVDPQYVSGISNYRLRPHLEDNYKKVEYFAAKHFEPEYSQYMSVGGQMGVFKCSEPIRNNS